jgi:hypothetical protein
MKLQPGIDYLIVKRAGYFDGGRTLQQHGNMVVTRNRIIINILQTIDVIAKMESGNDRPQSSNPFKELKLATRDMTQSFKDAKQDFRKMKDFGTCEEILKQIATESESLLEFEDRAAAMGEDEPKSLNILMSNILSMKFPFLGPVKMTLNDGTLFKLFITHHKSDVKNFLTK